MSTYKVTWVLEEIEADSAEEAAKIALEIQRDHNSMATEFIVKDLESNVFKTVELSELACKHEHEQINDRCTFSCATCCEELGR
jgi:hypothetical protein